MVVLTKKDMRIKRIFMSRRPTNHVPLGGVFREVPGGFKQGEQRWLNIRTVMKPESQEGQTEEITQAQQVFFDRVGVPLKGTKLIAWYIGKSPATIVRWRKRFRGSEEILLCFPAMLIPTGRGQGFQLWSHTALIKDWMNRWSAIDAARLRERGRWRRVRKVTRLGETRKPPAPPFKGESAPSLHEKPAKQENPRLTNEELANLGPVEQAWVINHELTPAQREELGVKLAENRIPEGCTCGTGTPCSVCQG
jgi:hypothetical protein